MRHWLLTCSIALFLTCAFFSLPALAQQEAMDPIIDYSPVFVEQPCTKQIPLNYASVCGTLYVPENRTRVNSPIIELAVRIVKTKSTQPQSDPIVYLVGGPGGSVVEQTGDFFLGNMMNFARDRDVIFFDQRGTGASRPRLQCEGIINTALNALTQEFTPDDERITYQYASELCSSDFRQQGIDLSTYTSANNAADVNDLRVALGYDEWNLFGVSYGTRLALTVMRDYPEGIRSVILDSVYPPQVNLFTEYMANAVRALDVLFAGCRADARCYAAYPETEERFYRLYDELNATPQIVTLVSNSGDEINIVLNGDRLFDWVFRWLYNIDNIRHIPRWLYEIDHGTYTSAVRAGLQQELVIYGIDQGMYQAVQCYDEISFLEPESFIKIRDTFPQYASTLDRMLTQHEALLDVCTGWQPVRAAELENEPVRSDIPTLLLVGEYDPITPPAWAELAAQTLTNGYLYEVPGIGHAVAFSSGCGQQIALRFLWEPSTAPDSACLAQAPSPMFVVTRLAYTGE